MANILKNALSRGTLMALAVVGATHARADEALQTFFASDRGGGERPYFGEAVQSFAPDARIHIGFARPRGGVSLSGVSGALAAKAQEISSACGSTVISGYRHTRVAGTRHMSLHASGRAVDMRGNPSCIYAHLQGWAGGYSTDYGRVQHVHISLGGREDGLRFAHRGGHHRHYAGLRHHHGQSYAHRGYRRYARA
ncbi:MAG: hypothetical protein U1E28_00295 [Beijerinckiaceae bacterium]